jgi:hypothetical protein
MSRQHKHTRRKASRTLTWAVMILVPALAIVVLGSGLTAILAGGPPVAVGSMADTRALAAQGDMVTADAKPIDAGTVDEFMDEWQNTVRLPPSPRR